MVNKQEEIGYTDIPNDTMDAFCSFRIPGELRQVLDCIIRKTYGYHKIEDWIAQSQIVEMTGLLKGNVSRSLSKLITHKIVIKTDNKLSLNTKNKEWLVIKNDNNNKVIKTDKKVINLDRKVIRNEGYKTNKQNQITKPIIPTVLEASPPDKRNLELQELLDFSDSLNFVLQGTKQINRFNAYNLWKKFGLEKSKIIVRAAINCRGKIYAPRISDFIQLYRKVGDLNAYYQDQKGQKNEFRNFDN